MNEFSKWQAIIDRTVHQIVHPESVQRLKARTDEFFCEAVNQSWPYGECVAEGFWIKDSMIIDRNEINYMDSYGFYSELEESDVFSSKRMDAILNGSKLNSEEYEALLCWWCVWTLEDPDWSTVHAYDIQELRSTNGETCVFVMSDQEGDSLHIDLEDRCEGFFATKENALTHLRKNGLLDVDINIETVVRSFANRAAHIL